MSVALVVQAVAPVASFRRPLDHTYQRTLPLPPPTTLIGLAGAALGLATEQLWRSDSSLRELRVQVLALNQPARATDMWTLLKIKDRKMKRSPYLRELLFDGRFALLFSGPNDLLRRLQEAFRRPAYPLSLGREDELIQIEACEQVEYTPASPPYQFFGTILPGDLRMLNARPVLREGTTIEAAVVERLPMRFEVEKNGVRNSAGEQTLTLLPYTLQVEIESWDRPVYRWGDRQFVWLP
jgi:CRISPR-associated Cas5-like protein